MNTGLTLIFSTFLVIGCISCGGGPRLAPSASLDSYNIAVIARSGERFRPALIVAFGNLGFRAIGEGDAALNEADAASRAVLANFRVSPGPLKTAVFMDLNDYQTNRLVFSTEDTAKFYVNASERAAVGAVESMRRYYNGFSQHLYDVRMNDSAPGKDEAPPAKAP